jgi:regulator of sigma E protease
VGVLGLVPAQTASDYIHVRYTPLEALRGGVERTWTVLRTTIYYLGRMVTGHVSADQLRGPLGIAGVTSKVAQLARRVRPASARSSSAPASISFRSPD